MEKLPDLDRLSHAEKNDLIRALFAQNSRNSSLPPSTDRMRKPKPKSGRQPDLHPSGGQKGYGGHNLERVAEIRGACGKICRGEFPEGVTATVQYGSRIKQGGNLFQALTLTFQGGRSNFDSFEDRALSSCLT